MPRLSSRSSLSSSAVTPALIHPETSLALSPSRLRALLTAGGAARSLVTKEPLAIARALFESEHSAELAAAFAPVERFTHGVGPLALLEGAKVVGLTVSEKARAEGPADVAAEVYLASLGKGPAAVLAERAMGRAGIRMDRFFVHRASYELVGGSVLPAPAKKRGTTEIFADVERHLATWLGASFRAFWSAVDREGRLHAAILYVAPPSVVLTWPANAVATRTVTPHLVADLVRVDLGEARILVTPAREPHLAPLARAFGAGIRGDADYYGLRPSFSPKKLQALGAHGFARLPRPEGIEWWSTVGLQWDSGREERVETRSDDAYATLEALAKVNGGYMPRLTLRVKAKASGRARAKSPVDLFIQLPHRITVSDPSQEPLARLAGKALGFFEPGAIPDDVRTLAPWVHFEWRWREVLGDEAFELLVKKKILTLVKTKKGVGSPEHRWLGSSVKLTELPGEEVKFATPLDFSLPAFDVEESEAQAWRLDEAALGRHLAGAMGLRAGGLPVVAGAIALGALQVKSGRAYAYYAAGNPPQGLVAAVRAACKMGATPVLLVPRGRRLPDEGIAQVELDLLEQFGVAATTGLATGQMAVAMGVEEEIDGWRLAGADEPLVMDRKKKRVWLLGVELVHLVEGTYKLIERLMIEAGGVVDVRALGEYVSGANDPDVVVRKRRARLVAQIEKSFEDANVILPEGIAESIVKMEGRGAYRLGVGWKMI